MARGERLSGVDLAKNRQKYNELLDEIRAGQGLTLGGHTVRSLVVDDGEQKVKNLEDAIASKYGGTNEERMAILRKVDSGEIAPAKAVEMLAALPN